MLFSSLNKSIKTNIYIGDTTDGVVRLPIGRSRGSHEFPAALTQAAALTNQKYAVRSLCQRTDKDVVVIVISATYTVMAASLLAWGILMTTVWAF
ncbi:hypothetical protein [Marinobacter halotolerans]|uniref:hypothetical protein n=1 Tax=Marinobacter halotolerans TaxID=1569211 RepID=UPI001245CE04|nr:hypothetical protein [Marinobacter halotolerans]